MEQNYEIIQKVKQIISNRGFAMEDLYETTLITEDLHIVGLDVESILEEFAKTFEVDLSELEFEKHFAPEGGSWFIELLLFPFTMLFVIYKNKLTGYGHYPVSIGHLVEVAKEKKWKLPEYKELKPNFADYIIYCILFSLCILWMIVVYKIIKNIGFYL